MISVSFISSDTRMAVARTVPGDQVHQTTEETESCSEMLGERIAGSVCLEINALTCSGSCLTVLT